MHTRNPAATDACMPIHAIMLGLMCHENIYTYKNKVVCYMRDVNPTEVPGQDPPRCLSPPHAQRSQDKIHFTTSLHSTTYSQEGAIKAPLLPFRPAAVGSSTAAPATGASMNTCDNVSELGGSPKVQLVVVKLEMHVPLRLVERSWKPKSGPAAVLVLNSLVPGYSSRDDPAKVAADEEKAAIAALRGNVPRHVDQGNDQQAESRMSAFR